MCLPYGSSIPISIPCRSWKCIICTKQSIELKKTVDKLDGMLNGHVGNLQGEYAFI